MCAPIERVKLLMQTANMNAKLLIPYRGVLDCGTRCVKEDGNLIEYINIRIHISMER